MTGEMPDDERTELEKLSASYEPDVTGPMIGERQSSQVLLAEYEKADPVWARKIRNIIVSHPAYRKVKGDGNCGFRAVAFRYLESLAKTGSPKRIQDEAHRLAGLNRLLDDTGQEKYMYEDWVDVTLNLMAELASEADRYGSQPESIDVKLRDTFNDQESANAITQHFRMITSAYMKLNPTEYAPFVPDMDISTYCQQRLDPFYEEIEHIGLKALVDVIISPANIAVECLYLDRSAGEEATVHAFPVRGDENDSTRKKMPDPCISLLYRPGHYDLLYAPDQ